MRKLHKELVEINKTCINYLTEIERIKREKKPCSIIIDYFISDLNYYHFSPKKMGKFEEWRIVNRLKWKYKEGFNDLSAPKRRYVGIKRRGKPIIKVEPQEKTLKQIWIEYKRKVWQLTKLQPINLLEHSEKRGFRGYHLDHVLSIKEAFKLGLPPETPADLSNLRFIPHKQNMLKGTRREYTNLFNETL